MRIRIPTVSTHAPLPKAKAVWMLLQTPTTQSGDRHYKSIGVYATAPQTLLPGTSKATSQHESGA